MKTASFSLVLLTAFLLSACGALSSPVAPEATATVLPEPTASPTKPAPTATPAAPSEDLEIIEGVFRSAADESPFMFFPGEVVNHSDVALGFIKLTFTFVNEEGDVIYEGRAYADVPFVLPGNTAPYEYILDKSDIPAGETWLSYEVSVSAKPHQTYANVSVSKMTVEQSDDYYEIAGTFANNGDGICESPLVVVIAYDDDDLVVMSRRAPPVDDSLDVVSVLDAGEEVTFTVVLESSNAANLRAIAVCEK
jgi:hypothetical protein